MNFSPASILLITAVVLFILSAVGVVLGTVDPLPLGLAFFAAAFVLAGGRWRP